MQEGVGRGQAGDCTGGGQADQDRDGPGRGEPRTVLADHPMLPLDWGR